MKSWMKYVLTGVVLLAIVTVFLHYYTGELRGESILGVLVLVVSILVTIVGLAFVFIGLDELLAFQTLIQRIGDWYDRDGFK